ncbi:MAG: winged helix-turn-helix transcriptional regulator [Halieaceae bacterium]|jgi:DNA-binding transcriptional ArsR family regulator|nr:winged helix-turn-helix transcriptional regulator [Halieaceae bacterium]
MNTYTDSKRRSQAAEKLAQELDSGFFKALAEPVRVQILKFLMLNGCCDIGTIAQCMPQDRSVISRHLGTMLAAGLVTRTKESRHIYFDVDSNYFLEKTESIAAQIRQCMAECCIPVGDS